MAPGRAEHRPTERDLRAARGASVPDVIRRDLRVLFCGINPGLYSGAVGHHFARPGNRFWKALHRSGFTDRQLSSFEERELLALGLGITNLVNRATATAGELDPEDLRRGAEALEGKVRRYRPGTVAVLGLGAYRTGFGRPDAGVGRQELTMGGSSVWLLPNPSGLNAHYRLEDLTREFRRLREHVVGSGGGRV